MLHIDLSTKTTAAETFDESFARAWLGGNGFAAKLLFDRLAPGVDPLGPENAVVFAVGPITDTPVPGCSRTYAAFKSPLTGLYFDSTFGGRFALTLKRTGFEAVTVTGRSAEPVYLLVDEEGAQVLSAAELWGLPIAETSTRLRERHGEDADSAAVGPAGENAVRYACLGHHWKGRSGFAGRGGLGAVLGSKGVKAVVVRGSRGTSVADPQGLRALLARQRETLEQGTSAFSEFGTAVLVGPINALGALGTRNLQRETCAAAAAISGETFRDRFFVRHTSCGRCPVACGQESRVEPTGKMAPLVWKTPEFESLYALGSMLEIYDPPALLAANQLCDELGLDTITAGVTLAFAAECVERGFLTERDSGMALRFGDPGALLECLPRIARREGFGARLAEGSVRLASSLGPAAQELLYAVKGLEIAGHSARALKGMSIGYATATRGGSHHDARPTAQYAPDRDSVHPSGQARFAIDTQHLTAVGDSLTLCRFVGERGFGKSLGEPYTDLVRCVTGWDLGATELDRIGERVYNLERSFNVREGVRRKHDILPLRVMEEPIPDGPRAGMRCPREELDGMLDEYYRLRGWSAEGVPARDRLTKLGLPEAAAALWS
jgi:aldehyde:ferredoxin oxidoreductase